MKTHSIGYALILLAGIACNKEEPTRGTMPTPPIVVPIVPIPPKPLVAKTQGDIITSEARSVIYLDGTGSYDPNSTQPLYFNWKIIAGPAGASIEDTAAARTRLSNLKVGLYNIQLTVTNANKETSIARCSVNVLPNQAPVAHAGPDRIVDHPRNWIELYASYEDPYDSIVSYAWRQLAGPSGYVMRNADSDIAEIINLSEGTYQFELTVKDGLGLAGLDTVSVLVNGSEPATDSLTIAGLDMACPFSCSGVLKNFKQHIPQGKLLRKVAVRLPGSNKWKQIFNDPYDEDVYEIYNGTDLLIYISSMDVNKIDVMLAWR